VDFFVERALGIASVGWLAARVLDSVFRAKMEQPMLRYLIATALTLSASVWLLVALILLTIGVRTFCLDRRQGVYPKS
jgi:hypothetical protein